QDPPRQRDVPGLHGHPGGAGEGLHDRQQRLRGQERGFVGQGVDDLGGVGHGQGFLGKRDGAPRQGPGRRSGTAPRGGTALNPPIVAVWAWPGKETQPSMLTYPRLPPPARCPMREVGLTILMLTLSNVFMTFAWYAHLKEVSAKPWIVAALASWGVALLEYLFQVPANRIGYAVMSLGQLKILQE